MSFRLILICLTTVTVGWSSSLHGQQLIEDLTPTIFTYDQDLGYTLASESVRPLQVSIDIHKLQDYTVAISSSQSGWIFAKDVLLGEKKEELLWEISVQELRPYLSAKQEPVTLTLYPETPKEPTRWVVEIWDKQQAPVSKSGYFWLPGWKDTSVLIWFVLCFALLSIYYAIPRFFLEYFSVASIFSAFQREEASYKAPVLERRNLVMFLAYGLSLSSIGWIGAQGWKNIQEYYMLFSTSTAINNLISWLGWAIIITAFLVLKWIWVQLIAEPFNLGGVKKIQFFNYVRFVVFVLIPLSITLLTVFLMFPSQVRVLFWFIQISLVAVIVLRVALLYVKMRRQSSHRNVHLISYLCATEIAPVAILLKFFYSI